MNERGRDGVTSEWVFLNSVVAAVQCQRAATGTPAKVENGANKANRQLKVRPYATMVFGSISAHVQAWFKSWVFQVTVRTVPMLLDWWKFFPSSDRWPARGRW